MTRRRLAFAALLLAGAGVLAAPAAASAAPPPTAAAAGGVAPVGAPASPQSVDDFVFDSMTVDYELGRDGENRSTLHTTEHLVAVFPDFDQNRGIRRAIPAIYQGHATHVEILSVTDENGAPRNYEQGRDGEFLTLTIAVPEGQYVHGEQHYVIEYTQRDVTHYFQNTDDDEFYWDVNGTGWAQPFGRVAATVTLHEELVDAVRETACYRGYEGASDPCEVSRDGAVVTAGATDLAPRQNVTVVVAFEPGTFAAAPFDPLAYIGAFVPVTVVLGVLATIANLVFVLVVRYGFRRNAPGRGLVVAQYEPPDGVSIFLAADILRRKSKAMAATIVDLAVRRKLRIVERDASWGRSEFGLQLVDGSGDGLLNEERQVMAALFSPTAVQLMSALQSFGTGGGITVMGGGEDQVRWLNKRDTALGKHVINQTKAARKDAVRRGLRHKPSQWPVGVAVLLTIASFGLLLFAGITSANEQVVLIGVLGGIAAIWIGIAAIGVLASRRPLTRKGAELKEHLEGLKEFIAWAEEDRLRMLQSVSGAEREQLDAGAGPARDDDPQVIRVYERLLPYAVLFGMEKEWADELGKYYDEGTSPDWYAGSHGFTVGAFSAGVGSLSSSVAKSYSGSASSSSSGGSGGGGSSGGGGGGGGGGGV